ncbi:hypothetical protein FALBO_12621 [Fusarium albosuccineum]|uniref:Uncharacterized protein n=1 Tax=Fusarium albosuccineum TaxID=1237068 RepID=A0A8H4L3K2_9HYPO|nr:hypothetical protein FALBO_12621 [Fusarium albosuccineum]
MTTPSPASLRHRSLSTSIEHKADARMMVDLLAKVYQLALYPIYLKRKMIPDDPKSMIRKLRANTCQGDDGGVGAQLMPRVVSAGACHSALCTRQSRVGFDSHYTGGVLADFEARRYLLLRGKSPRKQQTPPQQTAKNELHQPPREQLKPRAESRPRDVRARKMPSPSDAKTLDAWAKRQAGPKAVQDKSSVTCCSLKLLTMLAKPAHVCPRDSDFRQLHQNAKRAK